ncbi:unnamed protein product [Euphydryas editha]|uniref:Uncharacterized protein n=1 Tax=Euphydryas editha TaxID=104508 RepID=A0AAU9TXG1_EUPED|nr:unnamed protein product [Euphydryas editha]
MYVLCFIERAAPLSASDESPRVSAAVRRENAVRCRLASLALRCPVPPCGVRPTPARRYVRIAARTTFAVVNNIYCIPAYVVWMMALRLTRPLYASLYWKIEGLMYHWLLAMVSLWAWTAGYESKYDKYHMTNEDKNY